MSAVRNLPDIQLTNMIIEKDKKQVGEIPDERLKFIGKAGQERMDVYKDVKSGRRYMAQIGRPALKYVSKETLKEWFNFAL